LAQSNQDAINSGNTTPADLKIPWDRGTEGTKNRRNLDSLAEFMVKANWKPYEGGNLKISLITNRNKFYFPISGALNQSDRNNNGYYEYPYNIYSIKYSHTFSDTLNTTLTIGKYELTEWEHFLRAGAYYSSPSFSNQNSLSGSSSRRNLDPDVTSQGNYLEKLSNLTIDWNVSYTGIKNNTILIGATYLEQGIPKLYFSRSTSLNNSNQITQDRLPEWYDQGPVKSKIQSLYVQDSIRIHEKLNLQVGARYDKHYLSSSFINPQSSLIWNITSRLTGRTLYSRGFREPSYNNLFSYNGTVGSITYAGIDPDPKDKDPRADSPKKLNPEKSESYESQISYYLLSDWKLNINLARSNIRDLITPYYSNSQWTWYFNNGRQQIDSLEGEISYNLSKKLLFMEKGSVFFYNVTYNKITNFVTETESRDYTASIVNSNNPPSEWAKNDFKLYTQDQRLIVKTDPRYWMNIGGVIRFLENYAFNFTAFYSAERYFGGYKGLNSGTRFYPETDKDYLNIIAACGSNQTSSCPAIVNVNTRKNGVRIGSYYTLNIGLSYDKIMENGSKIRISLQINNLFDRIYNAPYTNFSSTGAQILPNPQPGRQIYLTLTGYF
ncbi:MAG TPA: TonB-dependent receptor, partial [Leptospiraceae bacterium]|nr:TonB-dependent receptor [Leptospiraceae bacterium]